VFAANRLVLAVPAGSTKVRSVADVARGGATLAIGAKTVPIGSYTRTVLARLPAAQRRAILGDVRSEEPDVSGIVGKLTQGAVDAGFVYVSDVRATDGKLKAIELPKALQPAVAYGVAVVKGSTHPAEAKQFIDGLIAGRGQQELRRAGFEPPPER
jgi:molybdate transport system substrate-binding protein